MLYVVSAYEYEGSHILFVCPTMEVAEAEVEAFLADLKICLEGVEQITDHEIGFTKLNRYVDLHPDSTLGKLGWSFPCYLGCVIEEVPEKFTEMRSYNAQKCYIFEDLGIVLKDDERRRV